MSEIPLTINGREIRATSDQTILEAALANGIHIPNLCHDPRLTPTGACRLCLVEVEGERVLQTACTRAIAPGMIVHTETDEIRALRKTTLDLLLSEHRIVCTTCDADGDCVLQELAYEYQASEERFPNIAGGSPGDNYTTGNEAIVYDPSKCVRCLRCVKICAEVQMDEALTIRGRAADVEVSTAFDLPLNESSCELCGQCVSTCPTGALYPRLAVGQGRAKDLEKVRTTCPYCGVGCQMDLNVNRRTNRIVKVTSPVGVAPNDGNLCVKGSFGMDFVEDERRLTKPLIRRNGAFEEATWDEALTLVADRLGAIKQESGPDSIAGFSSAKCTNEENFLFQKLMRACIGTNNVDHCARLCHASTVAGLARAFGSGAMTNSIDELRRAGCIFVIGSNTTEAHPVIGLAIKDAAVNNGAKLVIADPRRIDLADYADLHISQVPGTDVALINGMMNVIIEEELWDREFVETRTEEFEQLVETVKGYSPEIVGPITSIPPDKIREAARAYATADTASIVYSMGITQHTTGTDNVLSLANLAMLTGNVGRECTGVNPLRGQNNVQGACDLGALPNVYPGYQKVDDDAVRAKFEEAWGRPLSPCVGLTIVEVLHAVEEHKLRALYVMGENPAMSDPNLNRTRDALDKVEFLVVQDIFLTETAEYADVVLPAFCFAEKDGTFTNTERCVQRVRKAVEPPGEARDDSEIICELATRMGYPMEYAGPADVMDEIASLSPIYGGMAYDRIDDVGLAWPCPDRSHPGTKFLHSGTFSRGLGRFHPVPYCDAAELPDEEFPLVLSTGRILYQFHTGTLTRKSKAIDQVSNEGYVEIHPDDANAHGIADGDVVEVFGKRGVATTKAKVTAGIIKGCVFMPFHFCEGPANMLTNDVLDPIAKIPEYKVCAVAIRPAKP